MYNRAKDFIDEITETMRYNEDFLKKKAKDVYDELTELLNDVIDYVLESIELPTDLIGKCMFYDSLWFIVIPQSYMAHIAFLLGNIASYYLHLRLILESTELAVFLDLKYNLEKSVEEKAVLNEYKYFSPKKLKDKIIKVLGPELALEVINLWEEFSSRWVHPASRKSTSKRLYGLIGEVAEYMDKHGGPPPYAVITPMNYNENDLDLLYEAKELTSRFRKVLKRLYIAWFEAAEKGFK